MKLAKKTPNPPGHMAELFLSPPWGHQEQGVYRKNFVEGADIVLWSSRNFQGQQRAGAYFETRVTNPGKPSTVAILRPQFLKHWDYKHVPQNSEILIFFLSTKKKYAIF